MKIILSILMLLSSTASADVLFRSGCGGEPFSHIQWAIYVPEGYTNAEVWRLRDQIWTVRKEDNSPECVWVDDVVVEGEADRFSEAEVFIDTNATEWDYELDRGSAVREGNTLFVRGDGGGDYASLTLTVAGRTEEYLVPFREEPRCLVEAGYDCMGYKQDGGWDLIYYGDGDTTVVPVEVLVTYYERGVEPYQLGSGGRYEKAMRRVAQWNTALERDRIYIRFVLKEVWATPYVGLRDGESFTRSRPVDIGLGRGTTYPNTCGVAYPNSRFDQAGFAFSNCFNNTDLHELGHVVGLAHGPNNSSYPATGYVFPEFGHGDYDQCIGGRTDDIMSYGDKTHFYNSLMTCGERFGDKWGETLAGDRYRADSAYHWNRIRYDLSLIHDEHDDGTSLLRARAVSTDVRRPLILD